MKTIEIEFEIGEKVVIHGLDKTDAVVNSIHFGAKGVTYEVAWFANGDRKACYVFGNELLRFAK